MSERAGTLAGHAQPSCFIQSGIVPFVGVSLWAAGACGCMFISEQCIAAFEASGRGMACTTDPPRKTRRVSATSQLRNSATAILVSYASGGLASRHAVLVSTEPKGRFAYGM